MLMPLLSDLARETAASNQRLAQAIERQARLLEQERDGIGKPPNVRRRSARAAGEILRYTLDQAVEAESIWDGIRADLEDGLEGGDAGRMLLAAVEAFQCWFELARATRNLWQVASSNGAAPEQLANLDGAIKHIEELHRAAAELLALVNRSGPPIDPNVLEQARRAVSEGRYKNPEAMRARLYSR